MGTLPKDLVPRSDALANSSELSEQVMAGSGEMIAKNDKSYLALIDAASQGLDDIAAGRVKDARGIIRLLKRCRK